MNRIGFGTGVHVAHEDDIVVIMVFDPADDGLHLWQANGFVTVGFMMQVGIDDG